MLSHLGVVYPGDGAGTLRLAVADLVTDRESAPLAVPWSTATSLPAMLRFVMRDCTSVSPKAAGDQLLYRHHDHGEPRCADVMGGPPSDVLPKHFGLLL